MRFSVFCIIKFDFTIVCGLVNVNSGANSVKYCDARTKVALIMSNLCRSRTIRRHSAKYDKPRTKEHIGKRHSSTVLH